MPAQEGPVPTANLRLARALAFTCSSVPFSKHRRKSPGTSLGTLALSAREAIRSAFVSAAFARSVILPSSTLQEGRFFVCAACFFFSLFYSKDGPASGFRWRGTFAVEHFSSAPCVVHCVKVLIEKVYVPFRHLTGSGVGEGLSRMPYVWFSSIPDNGTHV